ncbi:MAG: hypothetical protein KGI79_02595 [Patescibacteria group bacterium]|nr:hypothetical protein [Patescibacteria group bacterium]MDE2116739.1 hypothetical protein [Patescibacteria group bacterium]
MYRRNEWSGVTGRQFEEEFVAEFRSVWDGSYIPFRRAMEIVRRNQPRNAVHAEGQRLLVAIAEAMGVSVNELTLFTAAGNNALDWFHKVDAFIDFRGVTVNLDFKMRNLDSRKAFVVRPLDVENGFSFLAQSIASFIRRGMDMRGLVPV